MPNYNPMIILGGKKLWGTFGTVDYYTGQTAVNLTFWPKQEKKENESGEKIVKQFTLVWRSNSTANYLWASEVFKNQSVKSQLFSSFQKKIPRIEIMSEF